MKTGKTATEAWLGRLQSLRRHGSICIAREAVTLEETAKRICIDMNYPVVEVPERKLSSKFMFAEAYHILTGNNQVEELARYCNNIAQFSDTGMVFQGAYGPKVTEQMLYVINSLLTDMYTRQAVINIWRESPRYSKDIPCTLSLQFLIRDSRLHCMASMRSSDAWLGIPYDMFNFSCISLMLLIMLKNKSTMYNTIKLGNLTINMGSSHLYAHNQNAAWDILAKYETPVGFNKTSTKALTMFDEVHELLQYLRDGRDGVINWIGAPKYGQELPGD